MKIHRLTAGAVMVAGLLALTACGGTVGSTGGAGGAGNGERNNVSADSNKGECGKQTRSIKHDLGTTEVRGTPKNVVVTEFSFADAVTLAGITPIGIADDNKPKRVIKPLKERIGNYTSVGLRESPSLPVITSLKPDLIIIDSVRNKAIYGQLSKIAPTIALASQEASYQDNLSSMSVVGQALNRCEQVDKAVAAHEKAMAEYKTEVAALPDKPSFVFAVAADKTFTAHNAAGYVPSVLEALGLRSALPANKAEPQSELGLESLAAAKPQVMFLALYTDTTVVNTWQTNDLYTSIPAVKDKRTYDVDANTWARSRGLTAAELIAQQAIGFLRANG